MQKFQSFAEVHRYLKKLIPETSSPHRAYTLDRMKVLMEFLGNPQNNYKVIHVAGTSGKTSTCYFMAALLHTSGAKVGLTVSPHVDEVNERVQINLRPLSEKKYCKEFSKFAGLVEKSGTKPTYFEMLAAFALWEFSQARVEYVVVEVGLGGLLDATNVVTRRDKVCVITDIGLDHIEVLGKSIQLIAAQKAGIIQSHNTVFSYDQGDKVMEVFREVSEQQQAELHEIRPLKPGMLPKNLPLFQRRNWYLAWVVLSWLQERDGLKELDEAELAKSTSTYIPARMETLELHDKILIIDGSHNAQKLEALLGSIRKKYPRQPVAALIGFIHTKQAGLHDSLKQLTSVANYLFITGFDTTGAPKGSVEPLKIVEHLEDLQFENWEIAESPEKAFRKLLKHKEPILLVTGSFYLLNHIRPLMLKSND